jgi:hypothetical protein
MDQAKSVTATFQRSVTSQLLRNTSFSDAYAYWEQSGNGAYVTTTLSKYRTSPGYAFFGASSYGTPINSASGYLAQTVSVPSTAVSVSLTFYTYITTEELTTSVQHDKLFVRVISGGTSYLKKTRSNLNKSSGYVGNTIDLSSFRGQTITVQFEVLTDASLPTTFRLDDVLVTAYF